MRVSNGVAGFVSGDEDAAYVRIDPLEEVRDEEARKASAEFWPGLVVFGSDGGGEAFAFDTRDPDMPIVVFPWIGDDEDVIPQPGTLVDLLRRGPRFADEDHDPA